MPLTTEQVFIEFIADPSQLESTLSVLEKSGNIDKKLAESFKATNTQLNAQAAALKNVNNNLSPVKKSLEGLAVASKQVSSKFVQDFEQGLIAELKKSGVGIDQFKTKLDSLKGNTAFQNLQAELVKTATRIAQTMQKLEAMKSSGAGVGAFKQLEKQLIEDQKLIKQIEIDIRNVLEVESTEDPLRQVGEGSERASKKILSVKAELRGLREEIQRSIANGTNFGKEFDELTEKAGLLEDAMKDAAKTISTVGSDTRTLEGLVGVAQGVTGAFAIAQGTAALFGDESEELQKTLLKVNAAMAILQGLQSIQNLLQKESAAAILVQTTLRKIENAQIILTNALESKSIIVRYAAAAAQRILNAVMAANPIGIVAVALAGLIALLNTYGASAAKAAQQTSILTAALKEGQEGAQARLDDETQRNKNAIEDLKNKGAIQSEIDKQELESLKVQQQLEIDNINKLNRTKEQTADADKDQRKQLDDQLRALDESRLKRAQEITNKEFALRKTLSKEELAARVSTIENSLLIAKEGSEKQLNLQKSLIAARAQQEAAADGLLEEQRRTILINAQKEQEQLQADFNRRKLEAQAANIENQLVNVKEGSREELRLKQDLIDKQVAIDLTNTKLTEQEKLNIKEKGLQDQLKLTKEYSLLFTKAEFEAEIDKNNAELALRQTSEDQKLQLQIDNINYAAGIEIAAAEGNAEKIDAIWAKSEEDILNLKIARIRKTAELEIANTASDNGVLSRRLQKIAANERESIDIRAAAIHQLADMDIAAIDTRIGALDKIKGVAGSLNEDELAEYKKLQDDKKAVTEKSIADEKQLRTEHIQEIIDFAIQQVQAIGGIIGGINDIANQQDQQRIAGMREALKQAQESGSITEKEAIARAKKIDAEERKIKKQAAERDKQLALFNAVISTAAGIAKAIPNPVLIAFAAAIGAAQIALIAARPIPKFYRGKKKGDNYEGFASVGEFAPELIERNGKMMLTNKPTITWVGKKDIVYNPQETAAMLGKNGHRVNKELMMIKDKGGKFVFDYKKLGKEISKNSKDVTINVDADGIHTQEGMNKINYFNSRYTFK